VTDEKPLTMYLAYFLSDLSKYTSNETVRKTLPTISDSILLFYINFLTDDSQLFFSNYSVGIYVYFSIRSYREFSS
jgi:hypothetical protein